jgi:hypothetical protein
MLGHDCGDPSMTDHSSMGCMLARRQCNTHDSVIVSDFCVAFDNLSLVHFDVRCLLYIQKWCGVRLW